jgi:hypothetical protein
MNFSFRTDRKPNGGDPGDWGKERAHTDDCDKNNLGNPFISAASSCSPTLGPRANDIRAARVHRLEVRDENEEKTREVDRSWLNSRL